MFRLIFGYAVLRGVVDAIMRRPAPGVRIAQIRLEQARRDMAVAHKQAFVQVNIAQKAYRAAQDSLRAAKKVMRLGDPEWWSRSSTRRLLDPNDPHKAFWAWGFPSVDGPVYWIYDLGFWHVVWSEHDGWEWGGWNLD